MLSLPPTMRVYAATAPVDLRKGFDGLGCVVRQSLAADPLSGHLYVFFNRRANRVKVLFWTRGGYCIFYKRLERGRFHLPREGRSGARLEMDIAALQLVLEGVDLRGARWRPVWTPAAAASETTRHA